MSMRPDRGDHGADVGRGAAIQAVERAATVLSAFEPSAPRLTLGELTAALGVSKATAHRYTKALRDANLLRFDALTGTYSLGSQVLLLSAVVRAGLPILEVAAPAMRDLVRRGGHTAVLSVWDDGAPLVVAVDDDTGQLVRVRIGVGVRLSPFRSAQGRVFCAHLSAGRVPGLAQRLRDEPAFAGVLSNVRRDRLAVNVPGPDGVRAIAAPVDGPRGAVVAALAVVGTASGLDGDVDGDLAGLVSSAAAALSSGMHPPA